MGELFAVIGDPIGHSLSPVMHKKWLTENQLDHHYHAFKVIPHDLKDAILGLKALGVKGFNVTIPHKRAVIPHLDMIDDEARIYGAVNTVMNINGKLCGTNTDGLGFIKSLEDKGFQILPNDRLLIIGAGGAARAVGLALAMHFKSSIDVANRTISKAKILAEEISHYTKSHALTLEEASERLSGYQMVIQATPIGMSGVLDGLPFSLDHLRNTTQCVDLVYRPLETSFIAAARLRGCQMMNGLPMLIHQGALAFQNWLGFYPDTSEMETYLSEIVKLEGKRP